MYWSIALPLMKKQKQVATILAWVLITVLMGTLTIMFYNVSTFASIR